MTSKSLKIVKCIWFEFSTKTFYFLDIFFFIFNIESNLIKKINKSFIFLYIF